MILVDSSIYIECFSSKADAKSMALRAHLFEIAEEAYTTGLVITEVVQGIKGTKGVEDIVERLLSFPALGMRTPETYLESASIYRQCRKKGITIQSTIDILLATLAMEHQAEIFSLDKDFKKIAKIFPLKLHQFS